MRTLLTARHRNRFCPTLETCEDRTVPAVVTIAPYYEDPVEGGSWVGAFQLERTGDASAPLTVGYTVGGTATSGTDYTALSGSVTFAANGSYAEIYVTALFDTDYDPGETVVVSLSAGAGYTAGGSATLTIVDDTPVVSVSPYYEDPVEGGSWIGAFQFTRTGGDLNSSLTVAYTVGGTATAGADCTALSGTVTFAAYNDYAEVYVTALADRLYDPDETVAVTLASGTGYLPGNPYTATLTIIDVDTNAVPVATSDTFTGDEDTAISGNVLDNDTDADDDTLTTTLVNDVRFGTLLLNADGTFTYTPNANLYGTDEFTYSVSDGYGGTATANVTITVNAVNDAPVIANQSFSIHENLPTGVGIWFVPASDPDYGQTLTYSITGGNAAGVFAIDAYTGELMISDASGLDYETATSFALTVQVSDNGATPLTASAVVTISVENLAEDAEETEANRIRYLNDGYDYVQFLFYGNESQAGLTTAQANGPTGQALYHLDLLIAKAGAVVDAVEANSNDPFSPINLRRTSIEDFRDNQIIPRLNGTWGSA